MSMRVFLASAMSSGLFIDLTSASRRIFTRSAGTAVGGVGKFSHVLDGLEGGVGARVKHDIALLRRADVMRLGDIEADFLVPGELVEIDAIVWHPEGESVGFGNAVKMIHRDHRSRARHVLNYEVRISRNV